MPITLDGTLGITTPALTVTGATVNTGGISTAGNLTFSSTGQRILGDFTNATVTNRLIFQTSTVNSSTGIYAVPNGTSTAASWQATNAADPTNASKILIATNGSTDVQLVSGINGTGTYLPLTFYTSGAEKMRLDTSGNLGLGTTSPSSKFHIEGTSVNQVRQTISNANNGTYTTLIAYGSNGDGVTGWANSVVLEAVPASTGNLVLSAYSNNILFQTGSGRAERMRIDSSGNVGIGTSTPASYGLLAVSNTIASPVTIGIENGSPSTSAGTKLGFSYQGSSTGYVLNQFDGTDFNNIYQANRGHIWKGSGGVQRMAISSTGILTVSGNTVINGGSGNTLELNKTGGSALYFSYAGGASDALLQGGGNGSLQFYTGNSLTEKMRIDSGGNLLVGTTTTTGDINNGTVLAVGIHRTASGAIGAFPTNVATAFVTLPNVLTGVWLVNVALPASSATTWSSTYLVQTQNTDVVITAIRASSAISITNTGLTLKATQTSGISYELDWSITRFM